ncbi:metallophosphoesterase [Cryobacterium sp. MDB2-10]|uniref:metallophosphoesterase family protein n=1 Tax=Cryobacterium sp. MDB2-10 TaxID=1259177 RepID=UPI001431689C|nr:metallophosphoesterase [Cryobacterium sp. MDB2-10]
MGDLHGDLEHAAQAARTFADRGVSVVLQLGDWGVLWPGRNWQIDLNKLSRTFARHQITLLFVDGNHDWIPRLQGFPIGTHGIRWINENVGHLPRGYRTRIGDHFTLAALGGANSIDRDLREPGTSWWIEEQITEADLIRLGYEPADVLVGHEAPLPDEAGEVRRTYESGVPQQEAAYASVSRMMFRRAVLQTHPRLTLGGHYHRFVDTMITVPGQSHQTRVVVLDSNGPHRVNLAILNTATLDLEFLYRNGMAAPTSEGKA